MDNFTSALTPPTVLNDRYHILQVLKEGGFGTTYLAEDHHLPSRPHRLIKRLKPIHGSPEIQQKVKEKFEREAAIQEELGETNEQIPKLYAYFVQDNEFYLVEEYIDGDTLAQKVAQEGLLSEDATQKLLGRLLPVIEYIHRKNIIHRDIKPHNIIIRRQDGRPILIDFGAVRETMGTSGRTGQKNTRTMIVGTEGFSSPEQSVGRPVFASDIYSLGATAVYLLTGKTLSDLDSDPRSGMPQWRSLVSVTPGFADVIDRSLALNPLDRYQSAEEMGTALQNLSPGNNIAPTRISTAPPTTVSAATPAPFTYVAPTATQPVSNNGGEWKKAVIIGSLVGCSIIAASFVLGSVLNITVQQPAEEKTPDKPAPSASPIPSPTPPPSPSAFTTPTPTAVIPPSQPVIDPSTNAAIAGKPGRKNIRHGPGLEYPVKDTTFTGQRVRVLQTVLNSDNFPWHEVFIPGKGTQGWIAANLVSIDGRRPPIPSPPALNPPLDNTNATVSGEAGTKNLRSGPGTNYNIVGQVSWGSRIKIIGQSRDRGGYIWYQVVDPKSGRMGWIARQLVKVD